MKRIGRGVFILVFFLLLFINTTLSTTPGGGGPGWGGGSGGESGPQVGSGGGICGTGIHGNIFIIIMLALMLGLIVTAVLAYNRTKYLHNPDSFEPTSPPIDQLPMAGPAGRVRVTQPDGSSSDATLKQGSNPIGRGEGNAIRLNDPKVSSKHADLNVSEGQYTLTDLDSRNGTYVNGKKINQTPLYLGDNIQIGDSKINL